jgi:hypothetical protein
MRPITNHIDMINELLSAFFQVIVFASIPFVAYLITNVLSYGIVAFIV